VTHDVTKVEVRWAETHLKLKSHAPKERGRLTPRMSAELSAAQGQRMPCRPRARLGRGPAGPGQGLGLVVAVAQAMVLALVMAVAVAAVIFSLIFFIFSIFHMFCILVLVFHVVHMYLFETWFSWRFSWRFFLFLCSNLWFRNFVQIGSVIDFFFDFYFFQLSFFDFLFKIPFTMHNI
jgi:hypothetical protein